ncbi:hypothetical protein GQX74_013844 [Glossina fuscipes]|nr:hypothetical protein GQX74_013844 [Glossina fuscipes]
MFREDLYAQLLKIDCKTSILFSLDIVPHCNYLTVTNHIIGATITSSVERVRNNVNSKMNNLYQLLDKIIEDKMNYEQPFRGYVTIRIQPSQKGERKEKFYVKYLSNN